MWCAAEGNTSTEGCLPPNLIEFGAKSPQTWRPAEKSQVNRAAWHVGRRLAETYNEYMYGIKVPSWLIEADNEYLFNCDANKTPLTTREAFLYFYGGPVPFYKTGTRNGTAYGKYDWIGSPVNRAGIKVYTAANITSPSAGYRWATHELGHFFEARVNGIQGNSYVRNTLGVYADEDLPANVRIPRRGLDNNERSYGFAGFRYGWQQSLEATTGEEFADMFLGWNYNQWEDNVKNIDYGVGQARENFMNRYMASWIALVINREKQNTQ
jgi:hypothetical protein